MVMFFSSFVRGRLPLRGPCPFLLHRRWARVQDCRFVATQPKSDRMLEKYRAKLDQKAKDEGHESINALKEAYQDRILRLRQKAAEVSQGPTADPSSAPQPQVAGCSTTTSTGSTSSSPGVKPLSAYLDLGKVSTLPNKELEYIWRLRHASDPLSLCAVIPIETYDRIYRTAQHHPQFILPLPRPATLDGSGGAKQAAHGFETHSPRTAADIHFLQWIFHPPSVPPPPHSTTFNTHTATVIFTHLASFKAHGAYAQPHTSIVHHLDLADSHGLVLLNGSVAQGKGLSAQEGRWLVMCLQRFYDFQGQGDQSRRSKRKGLLERFSSGNQDFQLGELLDEAERVS